MSQYQDNHKEYMRVAKEALALATQKTTTDQRALFVATAQTAFLQSIAEGINELVCYKDAELIG